MVNKLLRHPLYAGLIKVKWFPDYIEGVHKPIISKETFYKVQLILDGKRPSLTPKQWNHPDFPLRRFMICDKCGSKFTGSWATGRNGVRYGYYHCRGKGCKSYINKQLVDEYFYNYLKSYQPTEEVIQCVIKDVTSVWKRERKNSKKERARLEEELNELQESRKKIDQLVIIGVFDKKTYIEHREEVTQKILVKQVELSENKIDGNDIETYLNFFEYFVLNIADLWREAELDIKQRLQALIFPKGVQYAKRRFRNPETSYIFNKLQAITPETSYVAPQRVLSLRKYRQKRNYTMVANVQCIR